MIATANRREVRLGTVKTQGDGSDRGLPPESPSDDRLLTVPVEVLKRHACIFGRSGTGKSATAMVLARELYSVGGVSVVVLDWSGEFASSALASLPRVTVYSPGANLTISPFARRSDNSDDDVERYVSLMHQFVESAWEGGEFSPYQECALREALKTCYGYDSSRLSDVLSQLEVQGDGSRDGVKGWLDGNHAVISRLTPIASGSLARVFDIDTPGVGGADLLRPGLHIVNLGPLGTDKARNMAAQILCRLLIDHGKKLGQTKDLRSVLIVDEAEHLAPNRHGREGVLDAYVTELTRYGMGLVTIANRPTMISETIIANSKTIVSHSLTSGKDIRLVQNYMVGRLGVEKFEADLRTLEVGECLVQLNDESTVIPVRCRIDLPGQEDSVPPPQAPVPGGHEADAPRTDPSLPIEVQEDDSARVICEKLPAWARRAAKLAADSGGSISRRSFMDRGHTLKQVRQMVDGRYPILEESGSSLQLTGLGRKIAMIEERPRQIRHGTEVVHRG